MPDRWSSSRGSVIVVGVQPVTFRFDRVPVTISVPDSDVLLGMLREIAGGTKGFDFATPIEKIDDARQVPAVQPGGVRLEPGEDVAVLRALQHLRFHPRFSRDLGRLWDALLAQTGGESYDYVLELDA